MGEGVAFSSAVGSPPPCPHPKVWELKWLRGFSLKTAVLETSLSSYLFPGFWNLLPASRSRKVSAETVGLTLLYTDAPFFHPGLLHSATVPNTNTEKWMLPHTLDHVPVSEARMWLLLG